MATTTSLSVLVDKFLPTIASSAVTYNADHNIFLTTGYTSASNNTYYQGIRLSNRIIVKYNIGQGYCRTFLNGVSVFGYNGHENHLIGSRSLDCTFFSEEIAKSIAIDLIKDYMKSQCKMVGAIVNDCQIDSFASRLVKEAESQTKLLHQ